MAVLIKNASKHSNYLAIHTSCYSLETHHSLKCAKKVQFFTEVTEVLQSITKIDGNVSFIKGRLKTLRR